MTSPDSPEPSEAILDMGARGMPVADLHVALQRAGYDVPITEMEQQLLGPLTQQAIARYQQDHGLEPTGKADPPTLAALLGPDSKQPVAAEKQRNPRRARVAAIRRRSGEADHPDGGGAGGLMYTVTGVVSSPDSPAVSGLKVILVDKNVGGDVPLGDATTDARGAFQISAGVASASSAKPRKTQPDLQVRVSLGSRFLAASEVRYNASTTETLNVVLPAQTGALPSEYEALIAAIGSHYDGNLADIQETKDRQDITFLANKSGWDARAVAMAALGAQFSQHRGVGPARADAQTTIRPELYYALFRAGLPASAGTLYQTALARVSAIWAQAIQRRVIPASLQSETGLALRSFQAIAASGALTAPAPLGPSTLGDLLQPTLGSDPAAQQRFADLYVEYRQDPSKLWASVEAVFGTETRTKIEIDGQLAYLTTNNAPLISALHEAEHLTSTADLALRGYHQASKWAPLLAEIEAPAEVPGATAEEKKARYAELLSAQVRVSFPTAVMADMVQSGTAQLKDATAKSDVAAFLAANQGRFAIGGEPIERYLKHNDVQSPPQTVIHEIKRLQRVYQITPNDQALSVLLASDLDSAYHIVRLHDVNSFARAFGQQMGEDVARQVYAQASTVSSAVINIATSYVLAQQAPTLGSNPNERIIDPGRTPPLGSGPGAMDGNNFNDPAQATLEKLFSGMSACACDDCKSVLSPAAYLVDLLDFINIPPSKGGFSNPQAVLLKRRPDIQYLPLTCENTKIELPYIDLVNETLEFLVANSATNGDPSLTGYQGHNTDGSVSSDELKASPQNDDDATAIAAYNALEADWHPNAQGGTWFPPPLPFHRDLQHLRLYFAKFGVNLHEAMAALRTTDALERTQPGSYSWRDILMERLGLSRAEYRLLSDRNLTLGQAYGYPDGLALSRLQNQNVEDFCNRLNLKVDELFSILKTRFVNSSSSLVGQLNKLGVSFSTLKQVKDGTFPLGGQASSDAAFNASLKSVDPAAYGGDIAAWVRASYDQIMRLIVLSNPQDRADLCDASKLYLCYPDPGDTPAQAQPVNPLQSNDFIRIIRFVRLWRKFGLTIELTDDIISALYPPAYLPTGDPKADPAKLDSGFLVMLPRVGFAFMVLDLLGLDPTRDLQSLLACWAPIGTTGKSSLYKRMFLSPTLLQKDPKFAVDPYGNVLPGTEPLLDHRQTLCAAFKLTGGEFDLIATDLGYLPSPPPPSKPTPLTVSTVSAVYGRAWLARTLRISVPELLALIRMTGLDPFAGPPDVVEPAPAEPPMVRFIRLIHSMQTASLRREQALYLIWNYDLSARSSPADSSITGLAASLRAAVTAVDGQFTIKNDLSGATTKALMALVCGAQAADTLFGLVNGTLSSAPVAYSSPQHQLPVAVTNIPSGLSYDDTANQLSYSGVLFPEVLASLTKAIIGDPSLESAVALLYQQSGGPFFAAFPDLEAIYQQYANAPKSTTQDMQAARKVLLSALLADLINRRKEQQAMAAVAAAAGVDAKFAPAIVGDKTVLLSVDGKLAAVADLIAIGSPGLAAKFFMGNDPTASVDKTDQAIGPLSYGPGAATLPSGNLGGPVAGIWSGYVTAPEDGLYRFSVTTDSNTTVRLLIGGSDAKLQVDASGTTWTTPQGNELSLTAGTFVPISLTVTGLVSALSLTWKTAGAGWQLVPSACLYSDILMANLRATYVRFLKVTSLAGALALSANEISQLGGSNDLYLSGKAWPNSLPIDGSPTAILGSQLLTVLVAALDYSRIKTAVAPASERLLAIARDDPGRWPVALAPLAGWNEDSIATLVTRLQLLTPLSTQLLPRLFDAYSLVTKSRMSAPQLIAATTNDPPPGLAADVQSAVRAHYAEADWLAVVRPINDKMRQLQRDALVFSVLRQLADGPHPEINTADKLFEYLLVDVQMEPCMLASRISLALTSIQLFIERCLRGLEREVNAADFGSAAQSGTKAAQWAWRKRYRIWQANREVSLLWPENWAFWELRDDQSPIFRETMKELLQSDITDNAAAVAYLNYLSKLEQLAKLEPCGMFYDPNPADGNVAHVVGRTGGAHRKYYYRRLEGPLPGSWSPWDEIRLDIEDTPAIPYVWKGRLLLFWLRVVKQAPPTANPAPPTLGDLVTAKPATVWPSQGGNDVSAILCYSEYQNGKWQPTKTSDPNRPVLIGHYTADTPFTRSELQLTAQLASDAGVPASEPQDGLWLEIGGALTQAWACGFLIYNTHSVPVTADALELSPPVGQWNDPRQIVTSLMVGIDIWSPGLEVDYRMPPVASPPPDPADYSNQVLQGVSLGSALGIDVQPPVTDSQGVASFRTWDAPFLWADSKSAFYVTTSEELIDISSKYVGFLYSAQKAWGGNQAVVPNLVVSRPQPDPAPPPPVMTDHFLASGSNIRTAIRSAASINFGGQEVGPTGGVIQEAGPGQEEVL